MKRVLVALAVVVFLTVDWLIWDYKFSADAKLEAYCIQNITDGLVSPGSAKFVEIHRDGVIGDLGERRVRLAVDSQNQQGGLVRGYYLCTHLAEGLAARLDSVKVDYWRSPLGITPTTARASCLARASKSFNASETFSSPLWGDFSIDDDGTITVAFTAKEGVLQTYLFRCTVDRAGDTRITATPSS